MSHSVSPTALVAHWFFISLILNQEQMSNEGHISSCSIGLRLMPVPQKRAIMTSAVACLYKATWLVWHRVRCISKWSARCSIVTQLISHSLTLVWVVKTLAHDVDYFVIKISAINLHDWVEFLTSAAGHILPLRERRRSGQWRWVANTWQVSE